MKKKQLYHTQPITSFLLWFFAIIVITHQGYAGIQTSHIPSDTLVARNNLQKGDSLLRKVKYEEAIALYKKASEIYREAHAWERHAYALLKTSDALRRSGAFNHALELADTALAFCQKKFGEENISTARAYYQLGAVYFKLDKFEQSQQYFKKDLKIKLALFGSQHQHIAITYNSIGATYLKQSKINAALSYYEQAIGVMESLGNKNVEVFGSLYNNIGLIYNKKGDYDLALDYFHKSLNIKKTAFEDVNHPNFASNYSNMGKSYYYKGEYNRAVGYYKNALKIYESAYGTNHTRVAHAYNSIGIFYQEQELYDEAQQNFEKALRIWQVAEGNSELNCAYAYGNIGELFNDRKQYKLGMEYLKKSLKIRLAQLGEVHELTAWTLSKLGDIYQTLGQHKTALKYHRRALSSRAQLYGTHHPELAISHIELGITYEQLGDLAKALAHYQKSIEANVPGFTDNGAHTNPDITNYISHGQLLDALIYKAKTLTKYAENKSDINYLILAYQTFQLCDSLIKKVRWSHRRHEDKVNYAKQAITAYEGAIDVCKSLYEHTKNNQYLYDAFRFSERGKAVVLSERLADQQAKQFSGLPDELLALEKDLKLSQSYYFTQMHQLKSQKEGYDTASLKLLEQEAFHTGYRIDSLKSVFEYNYPRYFSLKYAENTVDVPHLQKQLSDGQALIEYFEGDSTIYAFLVYDQRIRMFTIDKDATLAHFISQYMSSFDRKTLIAAPEQAYWQYTGAAFGVCQRLIAPILRTLPERIERLIIVPDGKLAHIPWDSFLRSVPGPSKRMGYKDLDYLFKSYAISYAHSASLMMKKPLQKPGLSTKGTILALAPSFRAPDSISSNEYLALSTPLRDAMMPLEWNTEEIGQISQHFDGSFLFGPQATEQAFKNLAGHYKILHLATHALVDNNEVMMSKLVFAQEPDSAEDGLLHTHELFNMNLSADLAVLSACNTGLGKLQKGEGVMSLGRAFAYAGCPSIVMSHWAVPDRSTSLLMGYFYESLSKGKDKDQAIREARHAFLNKADAIQEHPLYWAGFVLMGNTAPLDEPNTRFEASLYYWTIMLSILIGVGLLLMLKMAFRHRKSAQIH